MAVYLSSNGKLNLAASALGAATRSSVAVDGSGAITGMAFYAIQAEKAGLERDKERLEVRLKRLQRELDSTKQRLDYERS